MFRRGGIYVPKNFKSKNPVRNSNYTHVAFELKKVLKNNKSIFAKPERRDFGQHLRGSQVNFYGDELCLKVHTHGDSKATQVLELNREDASTTIDSEDEIFADCLSQPSEKNKHTLSEIEDPDEEEMKYTASMISIAKIPRVKLLIKKYTSYKKNTTEVRTLDEKIVCIEYDVFAKNVGSNGEPVQQLRVYFSLKPDDKGNLKNKINAENGNEVIYKEVEIIDGAIDENGSYLRDLKNILTSQKLTRNFSIFDVDYLYEKVKNNRIIIQNNAGVILTENDLEEIKNMILEKASSLLLRGFDRKLIKTDVIKTNSMPKDLKQSFVISRTILNEINNDELQE